MKAEADIVDEAIEKVARHVAAIRAAAAGVEVEKSIEPSRPRFRVIDGGKR